MFCMFCDMFPVLCLLYIGVCLIVFKRSSKVKEFLKGLGRGGVFFVVWVVVILCLQAAFLKGEFLRTPLGTVVGIGVILGMLLCWLIFAVRQWISGKQALAAGMVFPPFAIIALYVGTRMCLESRVISG